jgi:hypothetical protein
MILGDFEVKATVSIGKQRNPKQIGTASGKRQIHLLPQRPYFIWLSCPS